MSFEKIYTVPFDLKMSSQSAESTNKGRRSLHKVLACWWLFSCRDNCRQNMTETPTHAVVTIVCLKALLPFIQNITYFIMVFVLSLQSPPALNSTAHSFHFQRQFAHYAVYNYLYTCPSVCWVYSCHTVSVLCSKLKLCKHEVKFGLREWV